MAVTWETATDWDNAVLESGIAHESVTNTDHGDATQVLMGHSVSNPLASASMVGQWPSHEDAGSTIYGFNGGGDGTINGMTLGMTGILGSTAYIYDGDNDYGSVPWAGVNSITVAAWVGASPTQGKNPRLISDRDPTGGGGGVDLFIDETAEELEFTVDNGTTKAIGTSELLDDTWHLVGGSYDDSTDELAVWVDGVLETSVTGPGSMASQGDSLRFGVGNRSWSNPGWFDGAMGEVMIWNTALSASQWSTLYDVVNADSTLTTATKSLNSARKVNLEGLSYSLNGQSIRLDVIGSPGTASEEISSQTLDGKTHYSIPWSNSHQDYRIRLNLSTTDVTTTPTFDAADVVNQEWTSKLQITAQDARVFDSTPLSGTVTLNGSGVEGATVYCIDDTNQNIAAVTTTDVNGDYSVSVELGDVYHMVVQYEDGQGNQYNDKSKPFLAT